MPAATTEPKTKTIEAHGAVYCPLCTHTVHARITFGQKSAMVTPGQRCSRCSSSLDAGYVIHIDRAA